LNTRRQQPDFLEATEPTLDGTNGEAREEVFTGGGELGARIRAFNWSSTPMGPISTWPQSLKTAVRILITSRYAMWLGWGPDLTFLYNDAYAHMTLGKKHPWALGRPAREVWAEIWQDIGPRIRKVLETGEATWDEGLLLFLERSGYTEETYHTFSYSPLTGDDGQINGLLCVVTEETERIIGERRLRTLRSLAAGLSAKITEDAVLSAIGQSLETNRQDLPFTLTYLFEEGEDRAALARATGIGAGHPAAPEMIETGSKDGIWPIGNFLDRKNSLVIEVLTERFGAIPTGGWEKAPVRALLVPITGQGQVTPAGVFVAALNPFRQLDDGYAGFIGLVAGQIAAGIANARAYDEERKRAEALAAIDRAKTAFFSNVSHEFRTPLTLMLGPTENALATPEKALRGAELETVHRNELRLLKLVNTLLDFSRLEAGRVTASYQSTDLCAYTLELASVFRSAMEKAGLTYIVDCKPLPHPVFVDHEMWEKIVLNLVSNALKSTFDGSIAVHLTDRSDYAELTVSDTGTGIPEQEIAHLFERFRRIENARRRTHEGSGIGLALVHELVNMHGGKISVQSQMGKGTAFTVAIPYGRHHLPQDRIQTQEEIALSSTAREAFLQEALSWLPGQQTSAKDLDEYTSPADLASPTFPRLVAETAGKSRVLLVDDNRDMREYVRRLLNTRFEVITAANGREALQKATKQPPNLVLSDVMMPEMDGYQLLAALRNNPATSSIPVVLLSARAGEDSLIEGMQSGADDYLVKPFTARELIARVDAHIKMARFRREAVERESRLQRELRESEREQRRLLEVMDQSTDFIGLATLEGNVLYVNKGGRALVGLSDAGDVHQLRIKDFFFPEDIPFLENVVIATVLRDGLWHGEVRFRHFQTGESLLVDYHIFPVVDPRTGETMGLATVTRDIRERKKTEAALRASESRFRRLIEQANVGVAIGDLAGKISYLNPSMLRLLGYTADDVREGRLRWDKLTPPEFADRDARAVRQLRERGTCDPYETEYMAKNGQRIPLLVGATMIVGGDRARGEVAVFLTDLTELKRAQSALLQSEKLAAVGRLSASIAHEINNPLEAVTNLLYLIDQERELPGPVRDFTRMAQQELARVSQIATQTLRFYRQSTARSAVRVSELLDSVLKLYQGRLTSAGVHVVREYGGTGPVFSFEGELRQVLTNLIGNALDASRHRGQITVREHDATDWRTGRKGIRVIVADKGHGMSPETLAHIFEPFFSTKGLTGTGLGLWVSLEIIQKHQGHVKVRSSTSDRHHGTVFSIFIPHSGPE
jgi:PAS domain S-box-containing protein